jgi:hypothetical protein
MKGNSPLFNYRPRYASGDIHFKSGDVTFFEYISRRKDVDSKGVLDIVAHGATNGIQIMHNGKEIMIDSRMLSKIIKKNPQYKRVGVRLLSCNTGSSPNGFAQNLANKLGVPVTAPNKLLWSDAYGNTSVAARSKTNPRYPSKNDVGYFVTFYPGGNKK